MRRLERGALEPRGDDVEELLGAQREAGETRGGALGVLRHRRKRAEVRRLEHPDVLHDDTRADLRAVARRQSGELERPERLPRDGVEVFPNHRRASFDAAANVSPGGLRRVGAVVGDVAEKHARVGLAVAARLAPLARVHARPRRGRRGDGDGERGFERHRQEESRGSAALRLDRGSSGARDGERARRFRPEGFREVRVRAERRGRRLRRRELLVRLRGSSTSASGAGGGAGSASGGSAVSSPGPARR